MQKQSESVLSMAEGLTAEQSKLVRDNLGLISVHLKHRVANLAVPRRDREWDDLFQEGCLGLIQAVVRFRPERGIPFAAFALPRIHNAVSKALHTKFATVYVPQLRHEKGTDARAERCRENGRPTVQSMSEETERRLAHQVEPGKNDGVLDTIASRLRRKYDRAVDAVRGEMSQSNSTRGDRDKLVGILVKERFMIPSEESKRALRQIARDTGSSYARVAQCEKQFATRVRSILEGDPEFRALRKYSRADPDAGELPVDVEVEKSLAAACAEELADRYRKADPDRQSQLLHEVLKAGLADVDEMVHEQTRRLPCDVRERLLRETSDERRSGRRGARSRSKCSPSCDGDDSAETILHDRRRKKGCVKDFASLDTNRREPTIGV